jgi:hypothetical protein
MFNLLLFDPNSSVFYCKNQFTVLNLLTLVDTFWVHVKLLQPYPYFYRSLLCEFKGVASKVENNLFQPLVVGQELKFFYFFRYWEAKVKSFHLSLGSKDALYIPESVGDIPKRVIELKSIKFYIWKVKDIVHGVGQKFTTRVTHI